MITGGAGTVTRIQVQVGLAAIPMRAYTASRASAIHTAPTYLTIRNLSRRSQTNWWRSALRLARRVALTGPPAGWRPAGAAARSPSPLRQRYPDPVQRRRVLRDPALYETDMTVPLTLTFARAGQVHVDAAVTAPGSP